MVTSIPKYNYIKCKLYNNFNNKTEERTDLMLSTNWTEFTYSTDNHLELSIHLLNLIIAHLLHFTRCIYNKLVFTVLIYKFAVKRQS